MIIKIDETLSRDKRTADIKAKLQAIDSKSIRPIREGDAVRVAALEAQAAALREELRSL